MSEADMREELERLRAEKDEACAETLKYKEKYEDIVKRVDSALEAKESEKYTSAPEESENEAEWRWS